MLEERIEVSVVQPLLTRPHMGGSNIFAFIDDSFTENHGNKHALPLP
jgi:hypothetical protein